jgi:hypothetical protein
MDPQTPTDEAMPMNKQEIVKEDGRTLIYYTFTPPDSATVSTDKNDEEAAHV